MRPRSVPWPELAEDEATMAESQEDIDALLAEVSALADEAIVDLGTEPPLTPAAAALPEPSTVEGAAAVVAGSATLAQADNPDEQRDDHPDRVLSLEVPVIVQLAERTMPLRDIIELSTGAIIEFEKSFDSELDLMINNQCVGHGQAVKVDENFGLRVDRLGTLRERIEAIAGR